MSEIHNPVTICGVDQTTNTPRPMGVTTDSSGNPAANVVVSARDASAQIIPEIGGTATSEIQVDVLTTAQIVGGRITVNAGDDNTAASRLANSHPDTVLLGNNETLTIASSTAITDVYVAFIANIAVVEAAYNAGTKTATGTIATNTTLADYLTVQVQFDFDSADAVKFVEVQLEPYSDGTTDKNLGRFKIVGYSS